MKELNDISKQTSRFRASLTVKMFTIGFLILIFTHPIIFYSKSNSRTSLQKKNLQLMK